MLALLSLVLLVVQLVLLARIVVDLIAGTTSAASDARSPLARARTGLHQVTEPVLAPVRRVLPPVRLGPVALDLAVTVVLVAVIVLRAVLP